MTDKRFKEYAVNNGKFFTVKTIDTIRDGGTIVLDTTGGKFYIHKDCKTFHSDYAPCDNNLIIDFLLIEYLIERIEMYIKRCEEDVERNKKLLIKIAKT